MLVAVALVTVSYQAWQTARSGWQSIPAQAPPRSDRELGVVLGGSLNGALREARLVIPRDSTFALRVGFSPPVDSGVLDAIEGLFRYWLLPRRYTDDTRVVKWVITFHHPAETLGVSVLKVIPIGPYTNIVEVAQ